jgi:hypothetical protein
MSCHAAAGAMSAHDRTRRAGSAYTKRQNGGRCRREDAKCDLRQTERRIFRREDEVAGHRQLEPPSEAAAPDDGRGDDRKVEPRVDQPVHRGQDTFDIARHVLGHARAKAEITPVAFEGDQLQRG